MKNKFGSFIIWCKIWIYYSRIWKKTQLFATITQCYTYHFFLTVNTKLMNLTLLVLSLELCLQSSQELCVLFDFDSSWRKKTFTSKVMMCLSGGSKYKHASICSLALCAFSQKMFHESGLHFDNLICCVKAFQITRPSQRHENLTGCS